MKDEKIKLHDKTFRPYIRHERILDAIDGVAREINHDFHDSTDIPVILCVLNGSIPFTGELLQRLDFPLQVVSVKLSSYQGTQSTGTVLNVMGLTSNVRGRRVIICNKPEKLDYVGMEIPNAFIVGFGLDYNELGRNIRDIYVIDE